MIIYLDENIPPTIATGFHQLQFTESLRSGVNIEVRALENDFGKGCKDETWIPVIGGQENSVITQDKNIHRMRAQRELCEEYNVGIFIISPPSKRGFSYWDMVKLLINKWQEIIQIVKSEPRPFAYKITAKGKIEKI